MINAEPALALETVGANPTRLWGLTMTERNARIAGKAGLGGSGAPVLLANADVAGDPAWFSHVAAHPGLVLTLAGVPALAHARDEHEAALLREAMRNGGAVREPERFTFTAYEDGGTIENRALRKRERPFLMELRPDTVRAIERASYVGAYKGVTDLLTKYLWPEGALWLTRLAAGLGLSPNMVTTIGSVLCVAATVAFAYGHYWLGLALGLVFMVLDTVDGKLARCTITSCTRRSGGGSGRAGWRTSAWRCPIPCSGGSRGRFSPATGFSGRSRALSFLHSAGCTSTCGSASTAASGWSPRGAIRTW